MQIDVATFAAVAAVADIIVTIGGGFFFMGKMTGKLDAQADKSDEIKVEINNLRNLVSASAVLESRLARAETDIQGAEIDVRNLRNTVFDLRRGVGFIQEKNAKTVDREY